MCPLHHTFRRFSSNSCKMGAAGKATRISGLTYYGQLRQGVLERRPVTVRVADEQAFGVWDCPVLTKGTLSLQRRARRCGGRRAILPCAVVKKSDFLSFSLCC